jgi:RNA polymerase sigma-70 factor (ECF subfamily)
LLFRARGAFKKALLGDVDTNGMSMGAILSVAARKAGEDAKKVGVQAMVLVLFLAVSVGAFFNFNGSSNSVTTVAESPAVETNTNDAVTAETGTRNNPLVVTPAVSVRERPEVELVEDFYVEQDISASTAEAIAASNKDANMVVYRASRVAGTDYILEAANGVTAAFNYDASGDPVVQNLVFTINADGILYTAYAQNLKIQVVGSHVYLTGTLSDLVDLNGLVYGGNALARALVQLDFDAADLTRDGKLSIYSKK